MKKKYKFRANVQDFKDADYISKLDPKTKAWYRQFESEYYANDINREGSIHKKALGAIKYVCTKCETETSRFDILKKRTYNMTNMQNRDLYAILGTGTALPFIEDLKTFNKAIAPIKKLLKSLDADVLFKILLNSAKEEAQCSYGRDLETILTEFAQEVIKLGASLNTKQLNKHKKGKPK